MGLVCNIPKFWINLNGLVQSSNLNAVETIMTRVFCMQGALKFHFWLLDIIPAAIKRISNPSHLPKLWIDRLATDVRSSIHKGGRATFHSSHYLPNLLFPREYTMEPKPFKFDDTDLLTSVISSTLRWWLSFPTDQDSLAQLTLLDIVTSKTPTSILFLDKIWEMYKTPFSTVFNKDWDMRRSKIKLTQTLANFEKQFSSHPFAKPDSLSYQKLELLSELIEQWMQIIGVDSSSMEKVLLLKTDLYQQETYLSLSLLYPTQNMADPETRGRSQSPSCTPSPSLSLVSNFKLSFPNACF